MDIFLHHRLKTGFNFVDFCNTKRSYRFYDTNTTKLRLSEITIIQYYI